MKFIALFLLVLIIFAISITFGANNDQIVTFNYLINQHNFRLSTLLALLLGFGFILGWLLTGIFYIAIRFRLNMMQRRLRKIEKLYQNELINNREKELTTDDASLVTRKTQE